MTRRTFAIGDTLWCAPLHRYVVVASVENRDPISGAKQYRVRSTGGIDYGPVKEFDLAHNQPRDVWASEDKDEL